MTAWTHPLIAAEPETSHDSVTHHKLAQSPGAWERLSRMCAKTNSKVKFLSSNNQTWLIDQSTLPFFEMAKTAVLLEKFHISGINRRLRWKIFRITDIFH
ncbi:MAG: hypothetical protein ABUL58_02920 [Steroidobacter sp.]